MDERFEKVYKMLVGQKRELIQKIRAKKGEQILQSGDLIDIATDSLEHELNYIFEEKKKKKEWLGYNKLFESNLRRTDEV